MSAIQTHHPRAVHTSEPLLFIPVEKYHEMIRAGSLTEDDPVELLEGLLVFKMPKDEPHNVATILIENAIRSFLTNDWSYRNQASLTLNDGEPEPDGAIVRGDPRYYLRQSRKPQPADCALVVEVAESSLARDRGIKLRSYARAGIAVYWIVNLVDRVVEVYNDPDPSAQPEPTYRTVTTYKPGDAVPVVIAGQCVGNINVSDILP